MSAKTATRTFAQVSPDTFVCDCGREFVAKTEARVGVTRSNAARHAAACTVEIEQPTRAAGTTEHVRIKDAEPVASPGAQVRSADMETAMSKAHDAQQAGATLALSPSGKTARMVTVSNTCYLTTDGEYVVEKDTLDAVEGKPWSLYQTRNLDTVDRSVVLVGQFRTCTEAFAPENVTA